MTADLELLTYLDHGERILMWLTLSAILIVLCRMQRKLNKKPSKAQEKKMNDCATNTEISDKPVQQPNEKEVVIEMADLDESVSSKYNRNGQKLRTIIFVYG